METVFRVVIIYIFLLAGLRILGKREFGELSPLELVTLLLVPEIVSQSLLGEDFSMTNAMIAVTTLFSLVFITTLFRYLYPGFERMICGTPAILVSHGKLLKENLNRERVDPEEIFGEMRKAGIFQLEKVQWAILEVDGKISFITEENGSRQMNGVKNEHHKK